MYVTAGLFKKMDALGKKKIQEEQIHCFNLGQNRYGIEKRQKVNRYCWFELMFCPWSANMNRLHEFELAFHSHQFDCVSVEINLKALLLLLFSCIDAFFVWRGFCFLSKDNFAEQCSGRLPPFCTDLMNFCTAFCYSVLPTSQ